MPTLSRIVFFPYEHERSPDARGGLDPVDGSAQMARSDLFTYEPRQIAYEQILIQLPGEEHVYAHGARLFQMHLGHGYALINDHHGEKLYWYRFGCAHHFVELSQRTCQERGIPHYGMCHSVYECKQCHRITAHDSSD